MSDHPVEAYEWLGSYSPPEARKLMDALEQAGICVHAEFHDGLPNLSEVQAAYGGFGASASVLIAVDATRRPDADRIHCALFGTGLPAAESEGSEGENWHDETTAAEVHLMERRASVAQHLDAIETESKALLDEIAAIDTELQDGGQAPQRLDALRRRRGQQTDTVERLLADKGRIEAEMHEIDSVLYGQH